MDSNSSNCKKQDLCFVLLLAVIIVLQFWKASVGMGSADEHFYTTLGYRFMKGDALFFDDWHIAQMISFFLEPLVRLFTSVTGSTNGIIRFMRFCYIAFNALAGTVFYLRFRQYRYAAIGAACIYLLYTPLQIMALSYNTMSAGFALLALCVYPVNSENRLRLVLTGLFASFAVINTPYLALIYLVLCVAAIRNAAWFSRKRWCWLSLGVLIAAALFIVYVGMHTGFAQVLEGLPHLIDPSHSKGLYMFARNIALLWRFFHIFAVLMAAELAAAFYCRFKKKEMREVLFKGSLVINLAAMIYVCFISTYQVDLGSRGTVLFPFFVSGLVCLILYGDHTFRSVFFAVSVFHALMILFSSNVGPRSYCGPLVIACMMTVLFFADQKNFYRFGTGVTAVLLGCLLFSKCVDVYMGNGAYDVRINDGPSAGLRDSAQAVERYENGLSDIRYLNTLEGENAMLITWEVWEYLALDKRIATFSTYPYFWEEAEYVSAQKAYEEIHPDRYPAWIYLDAENAPYRIKPDNALFAGMGPAEPLQEGFLFYGGQK